jgi:hypothetical protein
VPVILATRQAEIRRIEIPGQSRQKKFARPYLNNSKTLGKVVHTYHSSYNRKCKIGG